MTETNSLTDEDDHIREKKPLILLLLDGLGVAQANEGNLFSNTKIPTIKKLIENYPVLLLKALNGTVNQRYLSLGSGVERSEEDLESKDSFSTLSSFLSANSIKQLKIFESNRFAAMTYFFNGLREEKFELEDWRAVSSTFKNGKDLNYESLTKKIFSELNKELDSNNVSDFIVVSLPTIDLAARTGDMEKTKKEIVLIDKLLGKLVDKVLNKNFQLMISSVFGNAEKMLDLGMEINDNSPTKNPVPLIFVGQDFKGLRVGRNDVLENDLSSLLLSGSLIDLGPMILDIFSLEKPDFMQGNSLIKDLI